MLSHHNKLSDLDVIFPDMLYCALVFPLSISSSALAYRLISIVDHVFHFLFFIICLQGCEREPPRAVRSQGVGSGSLLLWGCSVTGD